MIISQDAVWQSGTVHDLTDDVRIAAGATLTIEPGAVVNGNSHQLAALGSLVIQGTANDRAIMNELQIVVGASTDGIAGHLHAYMAEMTDVSFQIFGEFEVTNSVFDGVGGSMWTATADSELSRNVFRSAADLHFSAPSAQVVVDHNVFDSGVALDVPTLSFDTTGPQQVVSYNSFIGGTPSISVDGDAGTIVARNNFNLRDAPAGLQHAPDLTSRDLAAIASVAFGTSGDDVLQAADLGYVYGGGGDDLIKVGLGHAMVDGGAGSDTLDLADTSWNHVVSYNAGTGQGRISASVGTDTTAVVSVERYVFLNGALEFGDLGSAGDRVYALFQGLAGRSPDGIDLERWSARIEAGLGAGELATDLLASPDTKVSAGAGPDSFVTELYAEVLGRQPEGGGLSYWTGALASGASHSDVAASFALSDEHLAEITPALDRGIFVPDQTASDIARVYEAVFTRRPDPDGLGFWKEAVGSGASLSVVANALLASPEGQAIAGRADQASFVDTVYQNALGRHAEASGAAFWTHLLDAGTISRSDVTIAIAGSVEAHQHLAPMIEGGWNVA